MSLESFNYENVINNFDNIVEQTKINYKGSLNRLEKIIGNTKISSAKKVIKLINIEISNTNVKSFMFSALIRVLESKKKQKTKYFKLYQEQKDINQKLYNNEPKVLPKELENVNLLNLQKTYKTYLKEKKSLNRGEEILGFYLLHPPRRLDYSNMEVIDIETEIKVGKNYLFKNKDKWFFIFTEYKTKKSYGIQKIEIKNKTLISMLNEKNLESGMTFYNGSKKTLQRDISQSTTTIFGKPLNIQQLRILWSSEKFGKLVAELVVDGFVHNEFP